MELGDESDGEDLGRALAPGKWDFWRRCWVLAARDKMRDVTRIAPRARNDSNSATRKEIEE